MLLGWPWRRMFSWLLLDLFICGWRCVVMYLCAVTYFTAALLCEHAGGEAHRKGKSGIRRLWFSVIHISFIRVDTKVRYTKVRYTKVRYTNSQKRKHFHRYQTGAGNPIALIFCKGDDVIVLFQIYQNLMSTWVFASSTLPIGGTRLDDCSAKYINKWLNGVHNAWGFISTPI